MKRSELLAIIKGVWADRTPRPTDDQAAEAILKAVEEAGMKPPLSWGNNQLGSRYYNWETENEEK
jgi:hypothetical protein